MGTWASRLEPLKTRNFPTKSNPQVSEWPEVDNYYLQTLGMLWLILKDLARAKLPDTLVVAVMSLLIRSCLRRPTNSKFSRSSFQKGPDRGA